MVIAAFTNGRRKTGIIDEDLRVQRTAGKRALMWFCIPWAFALIALIPGQDSWITVADITVCCVL